MNVIQSAIRYPVTSTVGVLFIILFGVVALIRLPIQLTPDVTKEEITVDTRWNGASSHEIEREIIDEQEEQLKGVVSCWNRHRCLSSSRLQSSESGERVPGRN
jgi:HAE1 family hydrophobic/amphiphilic exporter-1